MRKKGGFVLLLVLVCLPAKALAQPLAADTPVLRPVEAESAHAWALEYNPLALTLGRISANLEVAPTTHQALILSPMMLPPNSGDVAGGFWTELGYRLYSGSEGLSGFFVGPSLILGKFSYHTDALTGTQQGSSIGGAVDFGYQFVLRSGFVIGFGVGAQYQRVKRSFEVRNDAVNEIIVETGTLPRLLFSIGYAP
jgi:Protein of unknown function (DUF3575)